MKRYLRPGARPGVANAEPTIPVSRARAWRRRWDRQQDGLLPRRGLRLGAIVDALGLALGPRLRVLDLGCGTGSLSERILLRYPRARAVALDYDPVLLAIGRTGLGDRGGRLTWVEADLRRPGWEQALPGGRFDAVVSSTALHWLTRRELGRVYQGTAERLRPGGLFLNGDWIAFGTSSSRFRSIARRAGTHSRSRSAPRAESWSAWWQAALHDPYLTREAKLHRARFPRAHSRVETPDLPGHVRVLLRAGFREVEIVWSVWQNRVLAAVR